MLATLPGLPYKVIVTTLSSPCDSVNKTKFKLINKVSYYPIKRTWVK